MIELDREYPGYDADIKGMLLRKFQTAGINAPTEAITFANIGKRALAHDTAWKVYVGLEKPNLRAAWFEVQKML